MRASARCCPRYVDDPTLAREVSSAELVVLPYRDMHNSGTLLLALSLARPVLVPRTPNNVAVAAEVGPGWIFMYDGELDAGVIRVRPAAGSASRVQRSRTCPSAVGDLRACSTIAVIWPCSDRGASATDAGDEARKRDVSTA